MTRYSLTLTFFLALTTGTIIGQTYKQLISEADSLYNAKDYKKSNELFQQAFKLGKGNSSDLYNAACTAALAGENDNAFCFLQLAFQNGWTNIYHLKKDADLNGLHADNKWKELVNKMQTKVDSIEANYDKPLQNELLQIFQDDQEIRHEYIAAAKKLGYNNPTVDSLVKIMLYKDSVNLIKVIKILDEKGWVGKDKVGVQANQTIFLVIQHSDLRIQEKYLPMMRNAVKEGNAIGSSLALLEDRIALEQGKKQIYGSQIYRNPETNEYYIAPLDDPENVDKRRTEVGLGLLADYVKQWNIVWNIEKYKLQLPTYEQLQQDMMKKTNK